MANRQQRRAAQRNGLGDMLGQLAAKAGQANEPEPEDLNNLPKPNTQTIDRESGKIIWDWYLDQFTVTSELTTADNSYDVHIKRLSGDGLADSWEMYPETAKIVGQALVSAWNWKDIWKVHAGGFIAKELGIPEPKEDNGDE